MMRSKLRGFLIVKLLLLFVAGFLLLPSTAPHIQAQADDTNHVFIWREAALAFEYPADWSFGFFEDHPVLTSTPSGMDLARTGQAPGEPAMTFLYYPQARALEPNELMAVIFPDVEMTEHWLGNKAVYGEFADEANGQMVRVIAFESPATQDAQVIAATAPSEMWGSFVPALDTVLENARFLNDTAELSFFDVLVQFEYFDQWGQTNNGQVLVVAPTSEAATAIMNGDLENATPFVRAQLLVPSGVGVDPDSPTAAEDILIRFVGTTENLDMQHFDWSEEMPAAVATLEFNGLQLVVISVVNGDTALLMTGGASVEEWPVVRRLIIGSLNLTQFGEILPPPDLTQMITSQTIAEETNRPLG